MSTPEDRLPMAQAVLRPMPSHRTYNPNQTPEQRLERTIAYLESHNDEVRYPLLPFLCPPPATNVHPTHRSHILSSSSLHPASSAQQAPQPPQPCSKVESQAIAHELRTALVPGAPPPYYNPPPNPPASSAHPPVSSPTVKNIRDTVAKLEIFDEQARRTLAPFLAERERMKLRMEVLEGSGGIWGAQGQGQGGENWNGKEEGAEGAEGAKRRGTYDASRDPRIRR
ncbi:MAG: hypothetical protein Q9216_003441 [Gyalolechia sp. 2 TL-2023]